MLTTNFFSLTKSTRLLGRASSLLLSTTGSQKMSVVDLVERIRECHLHKGETQSLHILLQTVHQLASSAPWGRQSGKTEWIDKNLLNESLKKDSWKLLKQQSLVFHELTYLRAGNDTLTLPTTLNQYKILYQGKCKRLCLKEIADAVNWQWSYDLEANIRKLLDTRSSELTSASPPAIQSPPTAQVAVNDKMRTAQSQAATVQSQENLSVTTRRSCTPKIVPRPPLSPRTQARSDEMTRRYCSPVATVQSKRVVPDTKFTNVIQATASTSQKPSNVNVNHERIQPNRSQAVSVGAQQPALTSAQATQRHRVSTPQITSGNSRKQTQTTPGFPDQRNARIASSDQRSIPYSQFPRSRSQATAVPNGRGPTNSGGTPQEKEFYVLSSEATRGPVSASTPYHCQSRQRSPSSGCLSTQDKLKRLKANHL